MDLESDSEPGHAQDEGHNSDDRESESEVAFYEEIAPDSEICRQEGQSQPLAAEDRDSMEEERIPTRLIIERLELNNFKSYAGKKVIGPFHKRFSSVVGPNGSGKSNIIDALLFVFGKRASQVRLKKISELIHNSEHHQNLQEAIVTVHFVEILDTLDDHDFQPIPGSELVVGRTAYKNNTSKYSINGKLSNFTEVTQLLKSKGIDLDHNRFLILQGEVEQIAMMKPKGANPNETGVLEYLEDIIGSNKCMPQIEALQAKVEELQHETQSKLTRVKVSERERDGLEGAKNEAETYIKEEHRLLCAKAKLYQFFTHQSKKNAESLRNGMEELEERLVDELEKHKKTDHDLAELKEKYEDSKRECLGYEAEFKRFQDEYNKLDCRDVQLRAALTHTEANLKKFKSKIKKCKKKIEESERAVEENAAAIPALETEIEEETMHLESEEKKRKPMFEKVSRKTEHLRKELEAKQKILLPLKHSVVQCEQELATIVSQIEIHVKAAESAKENLNERILNTEKTNAKIESEEAQITNLKTQVTANKQKKQAVALKLETVNTRLTQCQSELNEYSSEYDQGKMQINQNQNRGSVLSALSVAKASGLISGIHGRLGDLGSISSKFDVAISTACPSLNNIVVDTIETGQKCAEYLRQKQAGSTTFIILNKIRYLESQINRIFTAPAEATRLFDLIQVPNNIFRVAFYFALRDTLVTDNLDLATKIGLESGKRQRVVTLTGDLVDPSGTMSGGGRNVARGGMGSSIPQGPEISAGKLKDLEDSISSLNSEISTLTHSKRTLELELDCLSSEIHNSEIALHRAQNAYQTLVQIKEEDANVIQSAEVSLRSKQADAERIKESLNSKQKAAESRMAKALSNTESIEKEVQELEQQIFETGGQELQDQIKLVQFTKDNIDSLKDKITRHQVNRDSSMKAVEDARKRIDICKSEFQEGEEELKRIHSEIQELEELAAEVVASRDEAAEIAKARKAELVKLKKECQQMSSEYEKARKVEHDIRMQLDDHQRKVDENKKKSHAWQHKLSEITEQIRANSEANLRDTQCPGFELQTLSEEDIEDLDHHAAELEIETLQESLDSMKPNLGAIEEYSSADRNYQGHLSEYDSCFSALSEARSGLEQLRTDRHNQFMAGFKAITMKLKEMYQMLTLGGDAELELVDSLDPFSEGIVFSVRPPKKSWKNISNLSGGEKTLSSLALVFALHHYKPTPLYVMDEIDAALDFKNVSIVANYVRDRARNGQFIIISLRNNMFELANRLVGVYKNDNASKTITIDPKLL